MTSVAPSATIRRWPLDVDVSHAVPFDRARLAGWLYSPAFDGDLGTPQVVFAALAGGACSTGYWDAVADVADPSMVRYLADRGFMTLAFDHLGVGASSPVADRFSVTPTVAAAAQHAAVTHVLDGLRAGTVIDGLAALPDLVAVGMGHSMGGMILGVQQARHRTFDAIAVLGHGGDGMVPVLTADERSIDVDDRPLVDIESDIVASARVRFAPDSTVERKRAPMGTFLLPDVPAPLRDAFAAQQVPLLWSSGLTSMIPRATDQAKAQIDVPVFLAFGDHDLTDNYFGNLARYESTRDATLFVLQRSGHCHNHATTRTVLWDRLADWAGVLQV